MAGPVARQLNWPTVPSNGLPILSGAGHVGSTATGNVSRLRRVLLRRGRGSPVSRHEATREASARNTASPSMRAITWPTQLCTPMPNPM